MAIVLKFEVTAARSSRPAKQHATQGEVVFFPGVRYERSASGDASRQQAEKKARRARANAAAKT